MFTSPDLFSFGVQLVVLFSNESPNVSLRCGSGHVHPT